MTVPFPPSLSKYELHHSWLNAADISDGIDPFCFSHRIAAYRHLIEATNSDERFGEDNSKNPLWGLIFQLQWQHSSKRLGLAASEDQIASSSPWGYGNFTLCIVPYLGAIEAGLVEDVAISPPIDDSKFDFAYGPSRSNRVIPQELCPAIEQWKKYFVDVAALKAGDDQEGLRMSMWHAHKTSLDIVAAKLGNLQSSEYTDAEMTFLAGWCRMVDFLWASAWNTDFEAMADSGVDVLPQRPLEPTDLLNNFSDFPEEAAKNAENVVKLGQLTNKRHEFGLTVWRRAMRRRSARERVEILLDAAVNKSASNLNKLRLLGYILSPV